MNKDGFSFITRFKLNSVFTRIFLILIILCAVMMSIFYYFIMDVMKTNFEEKTYSAYSNILEQTSNSTNIIISDISKIMHSTMFNKNVMTSILAPNMMDHNKNLNLTGQLSDMVESYNLINYAFLYVADSNKLYTSNNEISFLSSSVEQVILSKYIANPYINMYEAEKNIKTDVRIINDRICLFQEFPNTFYSRKGTLMFELSKLELSKIIYGNINKVNQNIYIFDNNYMPVFLYKADYNAIGSMDSYKDKMINKSGFFEVKDLDGKEYTYFYNKSKEFGWIYVYRVFTNDLKIPFGLILRIIVPFFIVFILISLAFSFYITLRIYKPINKLMLSVSESSENKFNNQNNANFKNEYDFIGSAYEDTVVKMDEMMNNMTPIILENLFINILKGREISEDSVNMTLQSTTSPFQVDDKYSVILISIEELLKKDSPDVENDFYVMSVINTIYSLKEDTQNYISIKMGDTSIVVILRFPKDEATMNIKQSTINLCDMILNKIQSFPYNINTGVGQAYDGILNVKKSYNEAEENLNYRLYFGTEKDKNMNFDDSIKSNLDNTLMNNKTYAADITKNIIQSIFDGNINEAKTNFKSCIEEISKDESDIKSIKYIYMGMINVYIEKIVSLKINLDEIEFIRKKNIDNDFESLNEIIQVKGYTQNFCNQAIDLLDSYIRRTQYRHIERAKEYVENNYQNINLSLNMVSEYVGISSPYLSKLFKEILNVKFVDYLNQYRVGKAKYLIDNTDFTITDIGFKTGFNSMPTFFRVFKKYNGITPGQYRNIKS